MPTQVIISPPGTGKTGFASEQIREVAKAQPLAKQWAILPNQKQTRYFVKRLGRSGGAMGCCAMDFACLYQHILQEAKVPVQQPPSIVLRQLLKQVIATAHAEGNLTYFGPIADKSGVVGVFQERIAELKAEGVSPQVVLDYAQAENLPRLLDIAYVYAAYQDRLQAADLVDRVEMAWQAREALQAHPELGANCALVVLDGFTDFSAVELDVLSILAQRADRMIITLPGSMPMTRGGERKFARTLQRLTRAGLASEVNELKMSEKRPAAFQHLTEHLMDNQITRQLAGDSLALIEAQSPMEECREALRWMKAQILTERVKPMSCAMLIPDYTAYQPLLEVVAREYGVPLVFTREKPLLDAPVILDILDLLSLSETHFTRANLVNVIQSPFFDLSAHNLTPQTGTVLEKVSRYGLVIEGLDQWLDSLASLAKQTPEELPEDEIEEDQRQVRLPQGDAAAKLSAELEQFAQTISPPEGDFPLEVWLEWTEDLLERFGVYTDLEGSDRETAVVALQRVFRGLMHSISLVDQQPIPYSGFLAALRGTIESTRYRPKADHGGIGIQVMDIAEAGNVRYDAVALLGLSEGVYPRVERGDPYLPESVRAHFGLPSRLESDQLSDFYLAITRANRYLLITRPYLSEKGEAKVPSPYWLGVTELFEAPLARTIRLETARPFSEAASRKEVLQWAANANGWQLDLGDGFASDWKQIQHGWQMINARLNSTTVPSSFDGDLSPVELSLPARWSASRLETYRACPMSYFTQYVLGLEEDAPPEMGYQVNQLGSLLHEILEKVYQAAEDPTDVEQVLACLPQVTQEAFAAAPEKYQFRPTQLWAIEQEELLDLLKKTITALAEISAGWTPAQYEARFGLNGMPPLKLEIEGEPIYLHGVIDRVDQDSQGNLRVIDYKLGSSNQAAKDLIDGKRLQLALYALACRDALELGEPRDGFYWQIRGAKPSTLKLKNFKSDSGSGFEGAAQIALEHVALALAGIATKNFQPAQDQGGCPAYCPARLWCWSYQPATTWR
jgi:RecB family exonuclease/superfamily I DNA/RNA helicase